MLQHFEKLTLTKVPALGLTHEKLTLSPVNGLIFWKLTDHVEHFEYMKNVSGRKVSVTNPCGR
jgi:hypothetical protein